MTELTYYEVGIIYGMLTLDQFKDLPKTLQNKLIIEEDKSNGK